MGPGPFEPCLPCKSSCVKGTVAASYLVGGSGHEFLNRTRPQVSAGAAAHRDHVIAPHEDRHFADPQLLGCGLDHVQHHEQLVAVLLDLRPLVALVGILDGQRVQRELFAHLFQLGV